MLLPHHVINHLSYGDLKCSQRLVGWQDVSQTGKAQHACHGEQHLGNQLGVLLVPVVSHFDTEDRLSFVSLKFNQL